MYDFFFFFFWSKILCNDCGKDIHISHIAFEKYIYIYLVFVQKAIRVFFEVVYIHTFCSSRRSNYPWGDDFDIFKILSK